ncbi:hypothetical protein VCHA47P369_120053 [Vibrio chagasii]|nr:hypothetical protein VCHA48P435_110089 [Vibrio chagasii]CAH6935143.1 hypothetical protein VCHA47P369_120053 [Vibrio chagasii]CAH6966204.1 hypothetical protein VCHA49P381_110081 [Vibrio chagasii]CAH6966438.1 hypothetical protein VCHA51O448_110089 [Vibrio chagasii]
MYGTEHKQVFTTLVKLLQLYERKLEYLAKVKVKELIDQYHVK